MKFTFISTLALTMAGSATAFPKFLRSSNKATGSTGEVGLQIHGVVEDTLTDECHTILIDAFSAAYDQVYGVEGLAGTIKPGSEQVYKESSTDLARAVNHYWSLGYSYWYGVYWDCKLCNPENDPPRSVQTTLGGSKHASFENAMKDILDASSCAAFDKLTSVTIVDKANTSPVKTTT